METLTAILDALILLWLVGTWFWEGHHRRCTVISRCPTCGGESDVPETDVTVDDRRGVEFLPLLAYLASNRCTVTIWPRLDRYGAATKAEFLSIS